MRFDGVGASAGIGIGPAWVMVPEDLAVREFTVPADRVEAEIEFFERALAASRRDVTQIRNGIARELGEQEAAIYDAHLLMLDDPDLRQTVRERIASTRRNAGVVFRDYMTGAAARLERVEDEYLRERRSDILDVERRVLRHLMGGGQRGLAEFPVGSVVFAHEIGPSDVALLDRERVTGVVTEVGSRTSHSAIVARGRGIPAVVGVRGVLPAVKSGTPSVVDGFSGVIEIDPNPETLGRYKARRQRLDADLAELRGLRGQPAVTLDGHRVDLGANIELMAEVEQVVEAGADGIGLFRTEFFYLDRAELPSEEEQFRAYRTVAERMAPRPVIFRTMDLGGDKVASYLGATHETNPFLGYRGIRLALHHPEVFRAQLRAIYRASAFGRVRMMFPMIASVGELERAVALCHEVADELRATGVKFDPGIEIGMMVETPSAVWEVDLMAPSASFFSVGSNDLTQYTLAMDRDNEHLATLYEPLSPSVLRSIRHTITAGHAAGRWVGVCGEMAGDPRTAVLLTGLGVDELSMSCYDLPRVKAAIRSVTLSQARALADEVMTLPSAQAIRARMSAALDDVLPKFANGGRDSG